MAYAYYRESLAGNTQKPMMVKTALRVKSPVKIILTKGKHCRSHII